MVISKYPDIATTTMTLGKLQMLLTSKDLRSVSSNCYVVKSVYNDHPRDLKIMAVVYMWWFFRGHFCDKGSKWDLVVDRWSLAQI
jgi:hypothetical protein